MRVFRAICAVSLLVGSAWGQQAAGICETASDAEDILSIIEAAETAGSTELCISLPQPANATYVPSA